MGDVVPWTEFLEGQNLHLADEGHLTLRQGAGRAPASPARRPGDGQGLVTFVSFEYLVLLLGTFAVYYLLPWRARIAAGPRGELRLLCYWEPWYAYLIGFTTLMDYVAALAIHGSEDPRPAPAVPGASIAANLGLLGYFKYTNFALDTVEMLLGRRRRRTSPTSTSSCRPASPSTRSRR